VKPNVQFAIRPGPLSCILQGDRPVLISANQAVVAQLRAGIVDDDG
jgi:hypothetical protein